MVKSDKILSHGKEESEGKNNGPATLLEEPEKEQVEEPRHYSAPVKIGTAGAPDQPPFNNGPGSRRTIDFFQKSYGNAATLRHFNYPIQAKLKVSQPNDPYEQEADRRVEQVMSMPESAIQRKPGIPGKSDPSYSDKQLVQKKISDQIPPLTQGKVASRAAEVTPAKQSRVESFSGGGQPLPESVRSFFEPLFGTDFGQVRVHTGSQAAESAAAIQARAFTSGQDVVFGSGEFRPEADEGRKLLAHELTHVVQQQGAPVLSPSCASLDTSECEVRADADASAGNQIHNKEKGSQFACCAPSGSRQELEADAKRGSEAVLTGNNYAPKFSTVSGNVLAYGESVADWFPNPEQQSRTEQRALEQQGLTDPQSRAKLEFRADSDADTHAARARYDISISASGGGGQIQSETTVMLDYVPDRRVSVVGPAVVQINPELGMGPVQDRPAFPYVLTFSRTINYSDRDGRTAIAEIDGLVFLSEETIAAQVSGATPSYEALLALLGDSGYTTASVQGSGPITAYFASYSATGNSLSIQSQGAASGLGYRGGLSLANVSQSADFVDPRVSAGEQYASLRALLFSADAAELARKSAEPEATSENSWFDDLTESLADLVGGALAQLIDAIDYATKAVVAWWDDLPPWARGILTAIGKFVAVLAAMAAIAGLIVGAAAIIGYAVPFGVVMLALGVIALAVGFVMSYISRLGEAWSSDNRWRLLLVPTVAVLDTLGISGIIEGISNESVLTGAPLNRTEEEQWETGTTGVLQLVGMFLMVRGMRAGPGGITVTPEVRGPIGDFHVLPTEKLPVLPEGHFWVRQGPEWVLFREPAAPEVPIEISIYSDGKGNINYNVRTGSRVVQSEAMTRPSGSNYQGGENRLPVELRGTGADNPYLEQGTGTLFDKGHGIDYVDRIEGPGVRSSNADVANFTPQARYWNSFLRNHLVGEIRGRGGGYRDMPIYSKNPTLTANGTPIPSEFVFVETSPTGQPRAAWRIPNDPTITTHQMTQLPQYGMSLSDIPSVMIRPGGGLCAPGSIIGPFGWISGERGDQEDNRSDRHYEIEFK
jgi:hypothetical protein